MLERKSNKKKKVEFRFKPDFISSSIADVDFTYLKKLGITACFIDLDGTVVSRSTYDVDPEISRSLQKSGLQVHIATNRPVGRDLKNLKDDLHAKSVIHPKGISPKPSKQYYYYALRDTGLKASEVVMIGDRYFQDILGANRSGIYSLLVYKLGDSKGRTDKAISNLEKLITEKFSRSYQQVKNK